MAIKQPNSKLFKEMIRFQITKHTKWQAIYIKGYSTIPALNILSDFKSFNN